MALRLVHFTRFPPRSTLFTPKSFFHSQPSLLVHRHHKKGALSAEIEREIAKRKGHLAETNSKELELIKENMETMKEKLFQIHLKKDETSSEFDDSDEAEDFKQGFKHSTARAFEKKARMSLTCTEFDSEGRIIASSVKRLKTDLCQKHGLHTRDLRSVYILFLFLFLFLFSFLLFFLKKLLNSKQSKNRLIQLEIKCHLFSLEY